MTKNNKKSKIPTKVEDLEDIDLYFKDSHNIEGFWVAQNYIATFQDGEQVIYDDFFSVDKGISAEDFEYCCLHGALSKISEHKKHTQLVKISSALYFFDRYKKKEQKVMKEFAQRQAGKWYFQPDQRGQMEQNALESQWLVFDTPMCRDTVPYGEMTFDEPAVNTFSDD